MSGGVSAVFPDRDKSIVESFYCCICMNIPFNAKQAQCCKNVYCYNCIDTWQLRNNSCAHCRDSPLRLTDAKTPPMVLSLSVLCRNEPTCKWKGLYKDLDLHLSLDCMEEIATCVWCFQNMTRLAKKTHTCDTMQIQCKYCKSMFQKKENHDETCLSKPVECEGCKKQYTRASIDYHKISECEHTILECPYENVGCLYKAKGQMEKKTHLASSPQVHLDLLEKVLQKNGVKIKKNMVSISKLWKVKNPEVGLLVDAQDKYFQWYAATIKNVSSTEIEVSYIGYSHLHDEKIQNVESILPHGSTMVCNMDKLVKSEVYSSNKISEPSEHFYIHPISPHILASAVGDKKRVLPEFIVPEARKKKKRTKSAFEFYRQEQSKILKRDRTGPYYKASSVTLRPILKTRWSVLHNDEKQPYFALAASE